MEVGDVNESGIETENAVPVHIRLGLVGPRDYRTGAGLVSGMLSVCLQLTPASIGWGRGLRLRALLGLALSANLGFGSLLRAAIGFPGGWASNTKR